MKLLIVGGAGQNKALFARGCESVQNDAHLVVQDMMKAGLSHEEMLLRLSSFEAVVCDEVGCGVVPIDAFERLWREEVGRLCCDLAAKAQVVLRVACGLPQVLKGDFSWK